MSLAQTTYPFALAALNVATGWLFYSHVAPVAGAVLVAAGLLVAVAVVGGLLRAHSRFASRAA